MTFDPALFAFDLLGALAGLALFWLVGRSVLDRWAERTRSATEYDICQRYRRRELRR